MIKNSIGIFSIVLFIVLGCNNNETDNDPSLPSVNDTTDVPATINYTVLSQFPHDTSAYTQGLELHNGQMFESTGDYTASSLRITNHKTGAVLKKHMMGSDSIFGEGITVFNGKIYQLTWQNNNVYVYDVNDITKVLKTMRWPYEGWGITHDSINLIISDGSANIYFVNPETFNVNNTISVKDNMGTVLNINELEYVNGFLYANVYQTNRIIKIDLVSGKVIGQMFFDNLLKPEDRIVNRTDYFNGIAYDSSTGNFLITGKRWPKMFEIKLN